MNKYTPLKYFLFAFMPAALIIAFVGYWVDQERKAGAIKDQILYKQRILNLKSDFVEDFYLERLKEVYLISELEGLSGEDINPNDTSLIKNFLSIAKATNYAQVRLLDTLGEERLRINFKDNELPEVETADALQNKAHRYYFQEGIDLDPNEIYVSPIDLNEEDRKVEIPAFSVLRFVKPISNRKGEITYLLVFNAKVFDFFEKLKNLTAGKDFFDFHFINEKGYWLTSTNPSFKTFGFMYDSLKNENLHSIYPEEWSIITKQDSGAFTSDNGLFVWEKVCLKDIFQEFNNSHGTSLKVNDCQDLYLLGHLPTNRLDKVLKMHRPFLIISTLASILLVLSIFVAWLTMQRDKSNRYLQNALEELKQGQKLLAARNSQLESFARVASHDLREPLATILSLAKSLEEKTANIEPKIARGIRLISDSAFRMDQLTKGILNYVRTGKNSITEDIDCMVMVQRITDDLSASITQNHVQVTYSDLPTLFGYRFEMRQLFQNIISNAIKYRKPEIPPVIDIKCTEDEDFYTFSISDNGTGIPENAKTRIFEMFGRGNTETEGLGIGLAMARKIVSLHNGKISVNSEVGKGSTFYFSISRHLKSTSDLKNVELFT